MEVIDLVQFVAPIGTAALAFLMGWDRYVRSQVASQPAQIPDAIETQALALRATMKRVEATVSEVATKTRDLHQWHNQRDDEGRPLWYRNKGVERAVDKLADAVDTLGDVVQELRLEMHRGPREGPTDHGHG